MLVWRVGSDRAVWAGRAWAVVVAALRQRKVVDPVAGPPPELAALRQTVDER